MNHNVEMPYKNKFFLHVHPNVKKKIKLINGFPQSISVQWWFSVLMCILYGCFKWNCLSSQRITLLCIAAERTLLLGKLFEACQATSYSCKSVVKV